MKTIVKIQFGSHLYGTNTETSDQDFKGVHTPPARDILLQRVQGEISSERKKSEGERNSPEDIDDKSYALHKYLKLLSEGQTVALDMLFAPDSMLLETSDIWTSIRFNKDKLLTKKSAAFLGYCRTQANKYGIKGSRVAAAKKSAILFRNLVDYWGPTHKLSEFDYSDILDEHTHIIELPVSSNSDQLVPYFECCNRKICFTNNIKHAAEVFEKIYNNYGDRSQLAEQNEGIDWKALSHAVRVGREALELLETGYITFPLADAKHILDIKKGRLQYKEVADEIEVLLQMVESASEKSALPDDVDHGFIEDLISEVYSEAIYEATRK
jgi:predicted nucleotidyltransferase